MDLALFGARLKELRGKAKVTQEKAAKQLGVTTNHYQKIEYGQINVSATTLDFLADLYSVSVDFLLGRE